MLSISSYDMNIKINDVVFIACELKGTVHCSATINKVSHYKIHTWYHRISKSLTRFNPKESENKLYMVAVVFLMPKAANILWEFCNNYSISLSCHFLETLHSNQVFLS